MEEAATPLLGLTEKEAQERLAHYGPNRLLPPKRGKGLALFWAQIQNPLMLLLIGAALFSFFLGDRVDVVIILTIVFLSSLLGFFQERGALNTLEELLQLVATKTTVLRDGKEQKIPLENVVPGDLVLLSAGDLIPADCRVLEAHHLFIDEATLTGESVPVEKVTESSPPGTPPLHCCDALFLGTMVSSGIGKAIVLATGSHTEYGAIAEQIRFKPPVTAFEIGVRKFSLFLLEITLFLLVLLFVFNSYLGKPLIQSLLFSLALAVGLTPQLLPAIITVNLCHGARRMAKQKVVVKRLAAIENFGQMDVLCTDKTGTVTEGKIHLEAAVGFDGLPDQKVAEYGFFNAYFQTGYSNPLDKAILHGTAFDTLGWQKSDELPYDFIRKRLSVVLKDANQQLTITKGALPQILSICNRVEIQGKLHSIQGRVEAINHYFEAKSAEGFRSLALAYKEGEGELEMIFLGFLHFLDPIKLGVKEELAELRKKGVHLKIITGDHHAVACHVASQLGLPHTLLMTGSELHATSDQALAALVRSKNVFAEIEPNQKERIILALRRSGHVTCFLGDGINDVAALHSADVGIAVDTGADAAKEAADIVLLEKDLSVLQAGIDEGRRTFINTMKYVFMATSANFGNMFSMAGASLFLPFLPLLPKQVLLTNFFSDLPEMALATDSVDPELITRPLRWDLKLIRRFMLIFGFLSSIADFLTFTLLLFVLHADEALFQSAWLIESICSAALVVLVIRTCRSVFKSRPSRTLLFAVFGVTLFVPILPWTPLGPLFNLTPPPLFFYPILAAIILFYLFTVEIAKRLFFRHYRKHLG